MCQFHCDMSNGQHEDGCPHDKAEDSEEIDLYWKGYRDARCHNKQWIHDLRKPEYKSYQLGYKVGELVNDETTACLMKDRQVI